MSLCSQRFTGRSPVLLFAAMMCFTIQAAEPSAAQLEEQVTQLYREGRYQEAIEPAQRAIAISERTFGPEHPNTATALNNLGLLYQASGAYATAAPLFLRALAIREKAVGPEHPDTAAALSNLAALYYTTGAYAKAEPLYERALAIQEKALGPANPATIPSLNNLAELYRATGEYAKAEPLYKHAIAIADTLGPDGPATASALNNLGLLYQTTRAYAKAEPLFQRALAIDEKARGLEHPDTATALNNLAELYRADGEYAKAEPLQLRALAIREKTLGPENPDTASSLSNLGMLYQTTGAYAKAERLFQRALAIQERTLGPTHPNTAAALNNLASVYRATGETAKAEPLQRRALAISEKARTTEDPETKAKPPADSAQPVGARSMTSLPSFPWPPPPYSASKVIPNAVLKQSINAKNSKVPVQLKDVAAVLHQSLRNAGYELSYFSVERGFALVSRMERITATGAPYPDPKLRFDVSYKIVDHFSIEDYLVALLVAPPGYFRIIVFIVSPIPFSATGMPVTSDQANAWLQYGANVLPAAVGNQRYSDGYTCTALIYEFEKRDTNLHPMVRNPGRLSGETHLAMSGIKLGPLKQQQSEQQSRSLSK